MATTNIKRRIVSITHDEGEKEIIKEIAKALDVCEIVAGLIFDRTAKNVSSAKDFVSNGYDRFYDPFLMPDMKKASERILSAIKNKEKIVVYGDYDVDGITSVCTLLTYLKRIGADDCGFYIPTREGEGYGLSARAVKKLRDMGYGLMITVDTGITAASEISYAKEIGLDTIVTDHHECLNDENGKNILPSVPCVNPKREACDYPFSELAGVGVVFKLVCAIEMMLTNKSVSEASEQIINELGELVTLGTVADVMPLYGENRAIVKFGLELMRDPKFVGLRELITLASGYDFNQKDRKKLSTSLISFSLAPKINAVGRMGNAADAANLFMTDDQTVATARAYELCEMNVLRQKEENKILAQALEKIEKGGCGEHVLVLDDDNWHHGVIGIVASRITERFGLASILISFAPQGESDSSDLGKGSGRSIKGLDLVKALGECKNELVRYGGHELAAGLTIERKSVDAFREKINAYAKDNIQSDGNRGLICADAPINIESLNERFVNELYLLEPYGPSNPVPQFLLSGLEIVGKHPLKDGKHTKLVLSDGKNSITALYFGMSFNEFEFDVDDFVDVLGCAELNEFMGKKSVQLHLKAVVTSKAELQKLIKDSEVYNAALHGGPYPASMLPCRDDFADVYRYLKKHANGDSELTYPAMCKKIRPSGDFPYIKLRTVLDVMCEMSLITYKMTDFERCVIGMPLVSTKVDIMNSALLSALKNKSQDLK